ncbi:MAG: flagellar hook-basal body protein [Clostridiales bacterium]|jgi:flagellar basal-body rod protein FlgG|nr:flagellar hook-basal body protein [Clostridiales bacterium]
MIRGLYTSALGMITEMSRMDAISNNIANVNTTGYKRDMPIARAFSEELMIRLHDEQPLSRQVGGVTLGVFVDDIYTDFTNGALHQTLGNLDLALSGGGFFSVTVVDAEGNETTMYTRDGTFTLSQDGTLITKDGGVVQGTGGVITLPAGEINIQEQGQVYVNNEYVDTLLLVDFEDYHTLRKTKDNYFYTTDQSTETVFLGTVQQGYIESSNVNAVTEMVAMITVNRAYEINQRMITIHDTTLGRAVTDIARK